MNTKYLKELDKKDYKLKRWSKWNIFCHAIHQRWCILETNWYLNWFDKLGLTLKVLLIIPFIPKSKLTTESIWSHLGESISMVGFHSIGNYESGVDWISLCVARHGFKYFFQKDGYP